MTVVKYPGGGTIDVYTIGDGIANRVCLWRLRRSGVPVTPAKARRTSDRWLRRWQAEHTGEYAHLGAVRAWTKIGAYMKLHYIIEDQP